MEDRRNCGAQFKIVAAILEPAVIERVLMRLGKPGEPLYGFVPNVDLPKTFVPAASQPAAG